MSQEFRLNIPHVLRRGRISAIEPCCKGSMVIEPEHRRNSCLKIGRNNIAMLLLPDSLNANLELFTNLKELDAGCEATSQV